MTSHKKMITCRWSFSFGFFKIHNIWSVFFLIFLFFFYLYIFFFEIDAWNFLYFMFWVSLWIFGHHTLQYMSLSLFPSQILVCVTAFAAHYLFSRFVICWAIKQKHKNCGKIYRHKSMHVSKPSRLLINHSWQAWRSIYKSHT